MKLAKFERKQAERGNWESVEKFREFHEITPCDCGKKKCKGWQVRWRFGAARTEAVDGPTRAQQTRPAESWASTG